ncbi:hypothetical protein [Rhodococcus phage RGL3]|uniref:Uncharacterized protein n=1 Tax=Rhodococcus phage RGL3 TaxID=2922221 RepID=G9FHM0_9CAUD|nr:hypothetical protein RoPhRGL3_gp28 [Rhodococcus phage RGL3]AEV52108.1 hypothetical protein [Rhodococcus phage RGL3]
MSEAHLDQLQEILDGVDGLRGAVLETNPLGFLDLTTDNGVTLARFFDDGVGEVLTFAYAAIPDLVREINELRDENEALEIERDNLAAEVYRREAAAEEREERRRLR